VPALIVVQLVSTSMRLEAQSLLARFQTPQRVVLELDDNERIEGTLQRLVSPPEPAAKAEVELQSEGATKVYPLLGVRRIYFSPVEQTTVVSDEHVRCFSLKGGQGRLPEPPDWFRLNGDAAAWKPAVLAHPNYTWLYIPGAAWIWSSKKWLDGGDEVCLFRQEFELKGGQRPFSGVLTLTADYAVDSAFLNERQLSMPAGSLVGEKAVFDVTHLVQEGKNVLAVGVRKGEKAALNSACVAYRLDLAAAPEPSARQSGERGARGAPGVVALSVNGDVLSGELASISPRSVDVRTPYAQVAADRDWVTMLYLNYEQSAQTQQPQQRKGLFQRILGRESGALPFSSARVSHSPFYWRTEPAEPERRIGIALKNGDFIDARLLDATQGAIAVKPRYGEAVNIAFGDVRAIYLNPGKEAGTLRYEPEDEQYRARLTLMNGDHLSGLVLAMSGQQVTFKPPFADTFKINTRDIVYCDLPYHYKNMVAESVKGARAGGGALSVALIGDPNPPPYARQKQAMQAPPQAGAGVSPARTGGEDSLYYRVSKVLYELGIDAKWLDAAKTANRQVLAPDNVRLLINVDENEHYYDTYQRPKDGYQAIRDFVQGGGDFAHFARGTPFYYAYRPQGGRWVTFSGANTLNSLIGLNVAAPGEVVPASEPFELPENKNMRLYFELNREAPLARFLPAEVEFPLVRDARFRPIRPAVGENAGTQFFPVYSLVDSSGKNYGVAMAVVRFEKPPHYAVYASHLLLDASYEDVPMLDYLVPHLIDLTLAEKR
jgi:hypothetical protein